MNELMVVMVCIFGVGFNDGDEFSVLVGLLLFPSSVLSSWLVARTKMDNGFQH